MSKNNVEEISKRTFNQSGKYALRKLSVGVVSVLIGTTMYAGLAHADSVTPSNESASMVTPSASNDNVPGLASDSGGSVLAAISSNIDRKTTSNANAQQFSSPMVNRLAINSVNQQAENGLQASLVQAPNNSDWTRNGYYQARASNVDFSLTDAHNISNPLPDENWVGFSSNLHFGIKTHFSVQTSDLKLNNRVYIGSIHLSNSLNDPNHNIAVDGWRPRDVGEFDYQGNYIGHIYEYQPDDSNVDFFLKVQNSISFATPVIDISDWSNKDISGYNWSSDPKYFVNVPDHFTENLIMPGGKVYHMNMYYDYFELEKLNLHWDGTVGTHGFNLYDYSYPAFVKNGTAFGSQLDSSALRILNEKNGQGLVVPNTGYQMGYSFRPSVNAIYPTGFRVILDVYVKDKNNKLTNDIVYVYGDWYNYNNVGNGYSLTDLKTKCPVGGGVYSLQNDGTYLCYINVPADKLVMDRNVLISTLKSKSKIVAIQGDQALQNTLNLYYNDVFGGRSIQVLIVTDTSHVSVYESHSVKNVSLIDPSNGQVMHSYDWHNIPDTLQLSGKAAIRVHYINGYNGQQIGNSQIFNDDQGKILSYQAQNSLGAGYSLRRSGSHALLNGQSLPSSYTLLDGSQKSLITYPRENTVSDVYYVIDPDPQQLVINYYDLAGKLVTSQQLAGYTDQRVPLSYSVPANYVLLTQSQPSSYQFGADHNELDLIVAPRVTVATDSRTVTRTIKVQMPDGQTKNVVQTVKFVRNSYFNQVTKQITYSPWSFSGQYHFSSYQPKLMDGYTADVIPAVIVTPDSLDTMVNVTYHKLAAVYSVVYQLTNGTIVKNVSVTPERDRTIHLTAPQGYRLLTPVTDVQVGHSSQKLVVLVVPAGQTYTVHDVLPANVTEPLVKTVTRTVKITMPNGHVRTVKQSVKFERTAKVKADGTVVYSNWQAIGRAQFNRVFVPKRFGYQLSGQADKVAVTADMTDSVVEIKYTKN